MTIEEASNKIKGLLDELPRRKTNKERLSIIIRAKWLVEEIKEKFDKQKQKEEALAVKRRIIKKALKQLLVSFDRIFVEHGELGDTAVRDKIYHAIHNGFIKPQAGYRLPATFGMFSEQGDELVRAGIQRFIEHPELTAARRMLKTPEARLDAFQDWDVETKEGTNFFEYFGCRNKPVL